MQERVTRAGRAEWQKRIERWKDSGLSAEQFASELGIKPSTLRYWKYALAKRARGPSAKAVTESRGSFVEVSPAAVASMTSGAFELELGNGRRLSIPARFDADALGRLLGVLERR